MNADAEWVSSDIEDAFELKPDNVSFANYQKESKKNRYKFAVVECSKELYEKSLSRRSIVVAYKRCVVDSSPMLMRCKTCGLLGHTVNHCKGLPEKLQNLSSNSATCLDCAAYNLHLTEVGAPKVQFRSITHSTNSYTCGTKQAFTKKYYEAREGIRGNENTNEDNDMDVDHRRSTPQHM